MMSTVPIFRVSARFPAASHTSVRRRLSCVSGLIWPCPSRDSLLHAQRRLSSTCGNGKHPYSPASPRPSDVASVGSTNAMNADDDGDEWRVNVFSPKTTPAAAERQVKTSLFLCLLLTLTRAQDWRDMVTAALRVGTWRPHHLDAVLRGVALNKYNEPRAFLLNCGGGDAALREAAAQAAATAPRKSSPTSRLQRARDVLVFCAEEGPLYGAGTTRGESASPSMEQEVSPTTVEPVTPAPEAVHHLLAMLLQAAQRSTETKASVPSADSALPTASYSEVWHFLAWMELHRYHVLSHAVLDALEAAVDEGGNPTGNSAAPSASSSGDAAQYAMVSQRIHRLDYVKGERALLRESMRSSAKTCHGGGGRGAYQNRQRDAPRTDPLE